MNEAEARERIDALIRGRQGMKQPRKRERFRGLCELRMGTGT